MNDLTKNILLWVVIAVVLLSVFNSFGPGTSQIEEKDYSTFLQEVRGNSVAAVVFDGDAIRYQMSGSNTAYVTYNPETDNSAVIGLLDEHEVQFRRSRPEGQNIFTQLFISSFPILLLIGVWI